MRRLWLLVVVFSAILLLLVAATNVTTNSESREDDDDGDDGESEADVDGDGGDEDADDDESDNDYDASDWFTMPEQVLSSMDLQRLRRSLLHNYDRRSRPVRDWSHSTRVDVGVRLVQINTLDEVNHVMTSTLQLTFRWSDEFLVWNETLYASRLTFEPLEIWHPDIIVDNVMSNFKFTLHHSYLISYAHDIFDFNERNKYSVVCEPSGRCRWTFPFKVMSVCELDQLIFPFDKQLCHLDLTPSAYYFSQVSN